MTADITSIKEVFEITIGEKEEVIVKKEILETELDVMSSKLNIALVDTELLKEELVRTERCEEAEARAKQLENLFLENGDRIPIHVSIGHLPLHARNKSRSSLGIVVAERVLVVWKSTEHGEVRQDSGMLWLDSLMEATNGNSARDKAASIVEHLLEAESKIKTLRKVAQKMILNQEEMRPFGGTKGQDGMDNVMFPLQPYPSVALLDHFLSLTMHTRNQNKPPLTPRYNVSQSLSNFLQERMNDMRNYIKRLKSCVSWYIGMEDCYLARQNKLNSLLELEKRELLKLEKEAEGRAASKNLHYGLMEDLEKAIQEINHLNSQMDYRLFLSTHKYENDIRTNTKPREARSPLLYQVYGSPRSGTDLSLQGTYNQLLERQVVLTINGHIKVDYGLEGHNRGVGWSSRGKHQSSRAFN
ncbi:hypothetical protein HPP92_006495 [Vanilla planifolia]|uniref:Uncharacterized protein n=1 Tax=Vanilla planifolia TaxID=51239 RepID=A0A835RWM6_VANPL|nr:hypothetical protein HPP92_006495 [Vanilla planifolia]